MADMAYEPRLKKHYLETVKPAMQAQFEYKNVMQMPKIEKIVINMGVGESTGDSKQAQNAADSAAYSSSLVQALISSLVGY